MKPLHLLPRPTVLMHIAWHRGADRRDGRNPNLFWRQRKGNSAPASAAANARPAWRMTPARQIALFTPKWKRVQP